MRQLCLSFLALLGLLGSSCGGGGGGGNPSVQLALSFNRSGALLSNGTFADAASVSYGPGDFASNLEERDFVSFSLSPLPAGASVQSAQLHLQIRLAQGDPTGLFGAAVMDHVDIGAGVDATDFTGGTLTAGYGVLPLLYSASVFTVVTFDVTTAVKADLLAARPSSTFRLEYPAAPSLNNATDNTYILSSTIGETPYVTVVYKP